MAPYSTLEQAAAAVADPATEPDDLAAIAQSYPALGALIAAHPNAYPGLIAWLSERTDVAVSSRAQAPAAAAGGQASGAMLGRGALIAGIASLVLFIPEMVLAAQIQCVNYGGQELHCFPPPPLLGPLSGIGLLLGIAAVTLGIMGNVSSRRGGGSRSMAITGIVLGAIGLVGALFVLIAQTVG